MEAVVDADVLVIGCGMAGLTAAAHAARAGARVLAIDEADHPGGSAALSAGVIWAPASVDAYLEMDQGADPDLIGIVVDGLAPGIELMRSLGVFVGERRRLDAVMNFAAVAYTFDVLTYLDRCRAAVVAAGGHLVTGASIGALRVDGGVVHGATALDRDGEAEIEATATVLATGGFQGDAELRRKVLGEHGPAFVVRANKASRGGGLRLAQSVGGAVDVTTDKFYGNLLPTGIGRAFVTADFHSLSQYQSIHSLLFDKRGRRLGDESVSYYENAWLVSRTSDGRALLVGDARSRALGVNASLGYDRVSDALSAGGRAVETSTLAALDDAVAGWGYAGVSEGVARFNESLGGGRPDEPARRFSHEPVACEPYFAIEVQPAITFPFAGIRIDASTRVLRESGDVVDGLLAVGADACVYRSIYGGGLSLAMSTGLVAASTAVALL